MWNAAIETLKKSFQEIRDERKMYANTATRIGNAFLSLLSFFENAPFLRKDRNDRTEHDIEVGGLLTAEKGGHMKKRVAYA